MDRYPNVTQFQDRHGKTRYRFRRHGKTIMLPESPGHPLFERAYAEILARPVPRPTTVKHPASSEPRSFKHAWQLVKASADWAELKDTSRDMQARVAERFLATPVPGLPGKVYGDMPIAGFQRRHVKDIIDQRRDTPHAAVHVLRLLKKLTGVALDQEWITTDPTYRVVFAPAMKGHRPWTVAELEAFEAEWPIGSAPRAAFALALYTGARRSDVAKARWRDIEDGGIWIDQVKTENRIWVPLHPSLRLVLDGTPKRGAEIVISQWGEPYSVKSLGMRFARWCNEADVPSGATMHGLRKTIGAALAEGGASAREIMAVLGHEDISQAELYTKGAEQRRLARAAMEKLPAFTGLRAVK